MGEPSLSIQNTKHKKLIMSDNTLQASEALNNAENCTHLAGNPVFSPMFSQVTHHDPQAELQGSWYIPEQMLYKTSSGEIGKYHLKPFDMPVTYHGRDQKFSEAQIACGNTRYNGFNTSLDKNRTMTIDRYVKRIM